MELRRCKTDGKVFRLTQEQMSKHLGHACTSAAPLSVYERFLIFLGVI